MYIRTSAMTLFSWFINSKKLNPSKNNKIQKENDEISNHNKTMWPTASVRQTTVVKQQQYINTISTLKAKEPKSLKPNNI